MYSSSHNYVICFNVSKGRGSLIHVQGLCESLMHIACIVVIVIVVLCHVFCMAFENASRLVDLNDGVCIRFPVGEPTNYPARLGLFVSSVRAEEFPSWILGFCLRSVRRDYRELTH